MNHLGSRVDIQSKAVTLFLQFSDHLLIRASNTVNFEDLVFDSDHFIWPRVLDRLWSMLVHAGPLWSSVAHDNPCWLAAIPGGPLWSLVVHGGTWLSPWCWWPPEVPGGPRLSVMVHGGPWWPLVSSMVQVGHGRSMVMVVPGGPW